MKQPILTHERRHELECVTHWFSFLVLRALMTVTLSALLLVTLAPWAHIPWSSCWLAAALMWPLGLSCAFAQLALQHATDVLPVSMVNAMQSARTAVVALFSWLLLGQDVTWVTWIQVAVACAALTLMAFKPAPSDRIDTGLTTTTTTTTTIAMNVQVQHGDHQDA